MNRDYVIVAKIKSGRKLKAVAWNGHIWDEGSAKVYLTKEAANSVARTLRGMPKAKVIPASRW